MGCDIHVLVHVLQDGKWVEVPHPKSYRPDRSYGLFATLAGMRDSWGINPIVEPRGLPQDVRTKYGIKADHDPYNLPDQFMVDLGDHTFSWLTLQEILDFDWYGQSIYQTGRMLVRNYRKWKKSGTLKPDYKHMEWDLKGRTVIEPRHLTEHTPADVLIEFEYYLPLRYYCSEFVEEIIPRLYLLHPDPRKVRFTFGFDN